MFWSITFSNPLPNAHIKKIWGDTPINVAQKKLCALTLKIQGRTLETAKGIPPINL